MKKEEKENLEKIFKDSDLNNIGDFVNLLSKSLYERTGDLKFKILTEHKEFLDVSHLILDNLTEITEEKVWQYSNLLEQFNKLQKEFYNEIDLKEGEE